MGDAFLEHMKQHSKVTVYILPLLMLNKFSFGEDNFIESYINRGGSHVCVEVNHLAKCILNGSVAHQAMVDIRMIGTLGRSVHQLWFELSSQWEPDVHKFLKGRYGRLSEEAKSMIRTYSGLPYRIADPDDGMLYTDYLLLALDRNKMLRDKWEDRIDGHIPETMDLVDPPGERDFKEFTQ